MLYINIAGNYGLAQLKVIADNLSDKIEGIPGVLSADVVGGLEREVKINVDANRLKYYSLSLNDVTNAISTENLNIPGGSVDIGSLNYLIRVPGEIEDPNIFGDLVVKLTWRDILYISGMLHRLFTGIKKEQSYSRENTSEAVTVIIKKQSGRIL